MPFIRISKVYALILFVVMPFALRAQPTGKWHAAGILPGLNSSGLIPKLLFVDSLLGYYIGVDTGLVTHDGGATWKMMNFPANARPSPSYIFAPDHRTIVSYQQYYLDTNGVPYPGIIKSTDMGSTWSLVSSNTIPAKTKAFTMWSEQEGFRIWVDDQTSTPKAALTHDGGLTFTDMITDATLEKYLPNIAQPTNLNIRSNWSDATHGALSFFSGSGAKAYPVLTTSDGGKSWAESFPALNGNTSVLHSYVNLFPGSQSIWVTPSVPKTATYFFYSTNFGSTWQTTPIFNKGVLGSTTKPGVVKLAPVSASGAFAILVSDTEHFFPRQNIIAYYDFSGSWNSSIVFPITYNGRLGNYPFADNIQFPDPNHGFLSVQMFNDTSTNAPALPSDTITIYRYYVNAPNAVGVEKQDQPLRAYPNPASSKLKIEGFEDGEELQDIKIFNQIGEFSVSSPSISARNIELDVRRLPAGFFLMKIATSLRNEIIPVVIIR